MFGRVSILDISEMKWCASSYTESSEKRENNQKEEKEPGPLWFCLSLEQRVSMCQLMCSLILNGEHGKSREGERRISEQESKLFSGC